MESFFDFTENTSTKIHKKYNRKEVYSNNIMIREIPLDLAINFVKTYHYSKILPKITIYYLGIFEDTNLVGVVTLGYGTQPLQTIKKLFKNNDSISTNSYIEIGKMCFLPDKNNSNSGSQYISLLIKWVKQNTECLFLYTLADGIMGKCGYVYQASNFRYIGSFETQVYRDKITGEKIHPRSSKTLLKENEKFSNKLKLFWLTHDFMKYKNIELITGLMFRYLYPLNTKGKKLLDKNYKLIKNPKDDDLIFYIKTENEKVYISKPNFNMDCFNYNFQNKERMQDTLF